jgi:hypothetical protein
MKKKILEEEKGGGDDGGGTLPLNSTIAATAPTATNATNAATNASLPPFSLHFYVYRKRLILVSVLAILLTVGIVAIIVMAASGDGSGSNGSNGSGGSGRGGSSYKNGNQEENGNLENENIGSSQLFIPSMCLDENNQPSKNCYGGWFYKTHAYGPEYNANFALRKHWNYVLLTASVNDKDFVAANVAAFRGKNIAVHLMTLEDTGYLDHPGEGYDLMKKLLTFVNDYHLDIQGVHIDCEPHGHPDWQEDSSQAVKNSIFQNFIRVLEECRQAVNEIRPNTTLSAAVAWWFSSHTKKGQLENGRGFDMVNEKRLDFIVPMIYDGAGGTADRVLQRAKDYLTDEAGTVIGMAAADYHGTLQSNVTTVIERSRSDFPDYFNGISIFSNHHYDDWGKDLDQVEDYN